MIKILLKHYLYEFAIKNAFEHLVNNFKEFSKQFVSGAHYHYVKIETILNEYDHWNTEYNEYYGVDVNFVFGSTIVLSCDVKITTRIINFNNVILTHIEKETLEFKEVTISSSDGRINDHTITTNDAKNPDYVVFGITKPTKISDCIVLTDVKNVEIR